MGRALMCAYLVYQAKQETIATVEDCICIVVRLVPVIARVASRQLYLVVINSRDSRLYLGW